MRVKLWDVRRVAPGKRREDNGEADNERPRQMKGATDLRTTTMALVWLVTASTIDDAEKKTAHNNDLIVVCPIEEQNGG